MCGICGIFYFQKASEEAIPLVDAALNTLKQRGPEVRQSFQCANVVLGHTRLSVIDPSQAANQPFTDETGNYSLSFNGEIYNYKSLRSLLQGMGVSFTTQSDTEVLLKWLIRKGEDGIRDLQGFFSFAFYSKRDNFLLLARDRFGIKPFLYYQDADKLMFASEMKALISMGVPRVLDRESLQIYFQLNYIPGPWSIFRDVKKLMPGHYMLCRGGEISLKKYYDIAYTRSKAYNDISYTDAQIVLRDKLEQAVVKRLVSDVPLGAFLSGGIDSSVIVALASRHVKHLKTFSIGFRDEPMFDETHYARKVADMHQTDHTEFSLTTDDLLGSLYDVLDYTDEPFADSSALAVNILSRETRSRVTVALSGDGADEMLAGYNKHMAEWRARNGGWSAQAVKLLHPFLELLPQSRNSLFSNKVRQLRRFGEGMQLNQKDRYWRWAAFCGEDFPGELLLAEWNEKEYKERKEDLLQYIGIREDMNDILRSDMHLVLTNDMLTKVDMMSMANSLEVRVPFLDHDVVDFLFSLPPDYKIDAIQRKKILKDAFRHMLPPELYQRPKQGFEVPLLKWFRGDLHSKIMNEWMEDGFIREQKIFNPVVINNLKKQLFSSSPGDVHAQIWSIVVFQHWYKKYYL